ncbi:hypothetical protein M9Y10_023898 [Tritrichomonas musculus]|uniref:Serine/threonine-protein phosphatase n=1 Tax=Tritrichomonas musculus TaxID=1915356 RepID=A0ABR2KWE5_9EUKA
MATHASYILTTYSTLLNLSLDKLFKVGNSQAEESNPIPSFDQKLLIDLCEDAKQIFENEENIIKLDGDVIVVGDIHGSFHDLLRILHFISTDQSKVVFLGDYVDRGNFSIECITLLFSYKIMNPEKFYLLRGNHEFDTICSIYGFKKEILHYHNPKKINKINRHQNYFNDITYIDFEEDFDDYLFDGNSPEELCDSYFANHTNIDCYKYTEKLYESFIEAFSYLPFAAVVNNSSFCIHGGLSPHFDRVDQLNKFIQRPIYTFDENILLTDILWGDPAPKSRQVYVDNPRGRGKLFNETAVLNFLKKNNLQRIFRAHECVREGVEDNFNEKCITVFSASSYNHDMGNKRGIIKIFKKNDRVESISFEPFYRLKKFDTIFFKVQPFDQYEESKLTLSQFDANSRSSYAGLADQEKSDINKNLFFSIKKESDLISPTKLVKSHPSRRESFGSSISFDIGLYIRKHLHCSASLNNQQIKKNISCLNTNKRNDVVSSNDNVNKKNSLNQSCLPMLNKKYT